MAGPRLASVVARAGGVVGSDYLRSGMRDLTFARSHYQGMSARAADRHARNLSHPIRIHVAVDRNGKRTVHLNDGRHRMTAAREAGAKSIRAHVVEYGPRGGRLRSWTGPVRLAASPKNARSGAGGGG